MKKILVILLLFPLFSNATNWYVSQGAAGTNAGTIANPWQSLADINWSGSGVVAGDFILLKKGDSFTGTLFIPKSGTAGNRITITSYGTGAKPKLIGNGTSTLAYLVYFNNISYITIYDIDITDPTLNGDITRDMLSHIQRAVTFDGTSSNNIIRKVNFSLVGVAVYFPDGTNNWLDSCDIGNLRMVVNTPPPIDDDYGANTAVIESSGNKITYCNMHDNWATSYDYIYDGGCVEFFGSVMNNNIVQYNIMSESIGIAEVTGDCNNNVFDFNLIINNGGVANFQPGHTNTNWKFRNNVFVLTQASLVGDTRLFYGTPQSMLSQNNFFYMRSGCDVASSGTGITESYNSYDLGAGSTVGYTLGTGSTTGGGPYWVTMTGNPITWNYHVISNIAGVPGGTGLNIDYYGVTGINDYKGVAKFIDPAPPASNQIKLPKRVICGSFDKIITTIK